MMNYTDVKSPTWATSNKSKIDCRVKFDEFVDYLPFTASPTDSTEWGRRIFADCVAGLWGSISEYVAPTVDWQSKAEAKRQSLLTSANNATADWRTELQLDVITDDDKASLVKWMAYIKAVKVLDLSSICDEESYGSIGWPKIPQQ